MKKVLIVYESLATPSTTVRALQFRDCFTEDAEIEATFIGRTNERMNTVMQHWPWRPSVRRPAQSVETSITRRREARIVELAKQHDAVMMMTVPSFELHQRLADIPNTVLITDLIDALWLPSFQKQGWQHIHEMLSTSDAVICENEYTARYTQNHNAQVSIVPDSPQIEVFDLHRDSVNRSDNVCRIGWIGGKYTADALYRIFEPLEAIFEKHQQIELRLLGVDPDRLPRFENVHYSYVPTYDQSVMVREVLKMHIGLFPMFKSDESLYRGTLKTRIYMAGTAAVIGQRLGENEDLIDDGKTGRLAGNDQEWFDALETFILDRETRSGIAEKGTELIRDQFSQSQCYSKLRQSILQCIG